MMKEVKHEQEVHAQTLLLDIAVVNAHLGQ